MFTKFLVWTRWSKKMAISGAAMLHSRKFSRNIVLLPKQKQQMTAGLPQIHHRNYFKILNINPGLKIKLNPSNLLAQPPMRNVIATREMSSKDTKGIFLHFRSTVNAFCFKDTNNFEKPAENLEKQSKFKKHIKRHANFTKKATKGKCTRNHRILDKPLDLETSKALIQLATEENKTAAKKDLFETKKDLANIAPKNENLKEATKKNFTFELPKQQNALKSEQLTPMTLEKNGIKSFCL